MSALSNHWLTSVVLAIAIAVAGIAVGQGLERFRMSDRSITVKGLAEQQVQSDFAIWTLTFRRAGDTFGDVQRELAADRERVAAFFQQAGFAADEIEVRPLQVQDVLSREYAPMNQTFRFNGSGEVLVKSGRVELIAQTALAIDPLVQAGVVIESGIGPRYQLRAFNDAKAPLLAEATQNAREQAIKFAGEAGAELGRLKSANQGVIQITGDDGYEYDSGGSIGKRLRVVSTFVYELK